MKPSAPLKTIVAAAFSIAFFFSAAALFAQVPGQRIEIPFSPNPVGSGARALGMGGAFIAVADDATAASWNPGGLIQLDHPEVSAVLSVLHRTEDNRFGTHPEADGEETVWKGALNYLSAAYPFQAFSRNMVVSLNYQHLYEFTREWDFPLHITETDLREKQRVSYWSDGDLAAFGLAYCVQILPNLSLGATLNILEDGFRKNEWETRLRQRSAGLLGDTRFTTENNAYDRYRFSGINANFGFLWNINEMFTLGGVFKTPFTADLDHRHLFSAETRYPDAPGADTTDMDRYDADEELDMPMAYGIGLACRFSDRLTAAFDLYRTEWGDFELKDAAGNRISPITGLPASVSSADPTHQIRIGVEYLFILPEYVIPVRAGLFYDPRPAENSPDDVYGFSLGAGIGIDRFIVDVAYEFRFGDDIGGSVLDEWRFSQDLREHRIYSSVIWSF